MSHRLLALSALGLLAACAPSGDNTNPDAPSYMAPTDKGISGTACSFGDDRWQSNARILLADAFDEVAPLTVDGVVLHDQAEFRSYLATSDALHAEWAALELNVALNELGIYGEYGQLSVATLNHTGESAAEVLAELRRGVDRSDDAGRFNDGFSGCDAGSFLICDDEDADGDGVPEELDCDDNDARLGLLLWQNDLDADEGYLDATEQLGDDWAYDGSSVYATDGGQEAMLSNLGEGWTNVAVIAEVTAQGTEPGCGFDCLESCGDYVPEDDCYTDYQAIALGILSFELTGTGVATLTNSSADYDICLEGFAMWDHPGSQSLVVGEEVLSGEEYRISAGSSLDVYYGSWTTDNGTYSPYTGEPDFWCYQNGTSMASGTSYESIGAWLPEDMQDLISDMSSLDLDCDGTTDDVDWADSTGVQGQHNLWDYQDTHAVVAIGKLAESTGTGTVEVTLTVQNRGALSTTVDVTDTVPQGWAIVSCDSDPDSETINSDGSTDVEWSSLGFAGCTDDCSTYDEVVITCEISSNLSADQDIVELPSASAAYHDGEDEEVSTSMKAAAFDYDWDSDGNIYCGETERWRAGILNRASVDSDQDEGYHGYRCALAQNAEPDCYDPGHFLQIGAFLDGPEDDINSECEGSCENPTFDQLARTDHDGTVNLKDGDSAVLTFIAYGDELVCEAADTSGSTFATAYATHTDFGSGETGLSTLNMYGDYANIKVCEAHGTGL